MALTKVIGAGLGTVTEDQVFGGATPTVTIGDAGAEDAKIVFDGNAQDYHIGLDDSADELVIGLGSALGTTTHMKFDANGAITKPLQPAFLVRTGTGGNMTNIPINATTVTDFGTEIFDRGADFSTNTFTAPVTGVYQLNAQLVIGNIDTAYDYVEWQIQTSNRNYNHTIDPDIFDQDAQYYSIAISTLADMDANDVAKVIVGLNNSGAAQMDLINYSYFSGYLVA